MIDLSEKVILDIGFALNEATILDVHLDVVSRKCEVLFRVVTLPDIGLPVDPRVIVEFSPVGRVMASHRSTDLDDKTTAVYDLPIQTLSEVVRSFKGCDIYGWEFIDREYDVFKEWEERISLDWRSGADGVSHTIDLFQDGVGKMLEPRRDLEFRIWFDSMIIYTPERNIIPIDDFVAGASRYWNALQKCDPRCNDPLFSQPAGDAGSKLVR